MSILAWTLCIASFLGGLSAEAELARPIGHTLSIGLFAASAFACPALWKIPPLDALLDGRQRAMACVALLLALPLLLVPAA